MSSNNPKIDVTRAEFNALSSKVEEGFLEMRRNQCRTDTQFIEIRKELNHHSQLLSDLKQDVSGLKQDVSDLKHGQAEQMNMLKQIFEIISNK